MRSVGYRERAILELPCAPASVPLLRSVRATLLSSSILGVRERELWDEYLTHLDPQYHEAIRDLVPGVWLPIAVAEAHYGAIDGLGLSEDEHRAMGQRVAERVQHGWAGTLIRGLKASGSVTPANLLSRFQQAWDRLFEGGAGAVHQTGPKDLRVECHGCQLATKDYFRNAWAGMFESTLELIARKVYVNELGRHRSPTTCAFGISWV